MTPPRKQLELAAKAAGIEGWWSGSCYCYGYKGNQNVPIPWTPWETKYDSFNLMVALLARDFEIISNDKEVCVHCFYGCRGAALLEDHNNDKGLATMWAVFLCAVEVGRAM
jgi:hypothetical protein